MIHCHLLVWKVFLTLWAAHLSSLDLWGIKGICDFVSSSSELFWPGVCVCVCVWRCMCMLKTKHMAEDVHPRKISVRSVEYSSSDGYGLTVEPPFPQYQEFSWEGPQSGRWVSSQKSAQAILGLRLGIAHLWRDIWKQKTANHLQKSQRLKTQDSRLYSMLLAVNNKSQKPCFARTRDSASQYKWKGQHRHAILLELCRPDPCTHCPTLWARLLYPSPHSVGLTCVPLTPCCKPDSCTPPPPIGLTFVPLTPRCKPDSCTPKHQGVHHNGSRLTWLKNPGSPLGGVLVLRAAALVSLDPGPGRAGPHPAKDNSVSRVTYWDFWCWVPLCY